MATQEKPKVEEPISFGGTCVCRRMTYECRALPSSCSVCHCVSCRKLSGAAWQVFIELLSKDITFYDNKEHLRYEGLPKDHIGGIVFLRLSKVGERAFCIDCHTPLAMRYGFMPETVHLTLGSVDERTILNDEAKAALKPTCHIFWEQRAWWLSPPRDGLPRHDRFGGTFEDDMKAWEGKHG